MVVTQNLAPRGRMTATGDLPSGGNDMRATAGTSDGRRGKGRRRGTAQPRMGWTTTQRIPTMVPEMNAAVLMRILQQTRARKGTIGETNKCTGAALGPQGAQDEEGMIKQAILSVKHLCIARLGLPRAPRHKRLHGGVTTRNIVVPILQALTRNQGFVPRLPPT